MRNRKWKTHKKKYRVDININCRNFYYRKIMNNYLLSETSLLMIHIKEIASHLETYSTGRVRKQTKYKCQTIS